MSEIQHLVDSTSLRLRQSTVCGTFADSVAEIWRRLKLEFTVELPLLLKRWKQLVFGLVMQYVHGIFTQLAHRMHRPQEHPLHDVGFAITPELGPDKHWVSETIFGIMFISFIVWTFTPFVTKRKRFYTAVLWPRLLMVLVTCQALRIITFTVTQVPGPSFHCRKGELTAIRPWPKHWYQLFFVDVGRAMSKSCGDLIFSSHTTFMLTGVLTYNEYGSNPVIKVTAWLLGVLLSILIIASRKHYTVDVFIAWYTVPLVFYMLFRRWTTRRPMIDFLGNTSVGQFDTVDGNEFDLDEAFAQHGGDVEGKPLLYNNNSSLPVSTMGGGLGAAGAEAKVKISTRASEAASGEELKEVKITSFAISRK